jgi:SAM-dependent methyltransferase
MNKNSCRASNSSNLKPVISLGLSPLANNLLNSLEDKDELYPLELIYCPDSHNCQLSYVVPAEKMFNHYLYVSSTSKSFRQHFKDAANKYIKEFSLNGESLVVDIGSNDGIALKPLQEKGIKVIGVEPATNISKIANDNNVPTLNEYFSDKTLIKQNSKVDLVTASNVFAHADDLEGIAKNVFRLLKQEGTFIIEVQYLLDTLQDLTFDNIYHEHVNYWSVTSLNNFFNRLGYKVNKVEHVDTHGGSIRVYVKNKSYIPHTSVKEFLEKEEKFGLTKYETYLDFAKKIEQIKNNVNNNIKKLKDKGLTLAGYGSPAKATTSLNYFGVKDINYIIEDNKLKHNKYLPGIKIPIISKEQIKDNFPDVIIIMAWNFEKEIKDNNMDLIEKGVRFISIKDLQDEDWD